MIQTRIIKRDILNILKDGNEHYAKDIKDKIRRNHIEEITEGVFANSFRKLVIEGKCENPERGIYIISSKNKISQKPYSSVDSNLKNKVVSAFSNFENEINAIISDYSVAESDEHTILYCMKIKHCYSDIKEKLKNRLL